MSCKSNFKKCKGQFFGNMVYFKEIIDFGQKTLTGLPPSHFCGSSDFCMQIGIKDHQRGLNYLIVHLVFFYKLLMDWRKDLLLVSFERLLIVEHEKNEKRTTRALEGPFRDPKEPERGKIAELD